VCISPIQLVNWFSRYHGRQFEKCDFEKNAFKVFRTDYIEKKAQSADQDLQKIIKLATLNKADKYILRSDLLYRDDNDELLLVVPKIFQSSIIRQAHEQGQVLISM